MEKIIKKIVVIVFVLFFIFSMSACAQLEYSVGRDTVKTFGNGRYQVLDSFALDMRYSSYVLYDGKSDDTIIDDLYGFEKIDDKVYLKGYNWKDSFYEIIYAMLNETDNKIVVKHEEDLSEKEEKIFSDIDRFINFSDKNHYVKKFTGLEKKYPVGFCTAESLCQGKYQILFYGCGQRYPLRLVDMESNNIIIDEVYGYCEKDSDYYIQGEGSRNEYVIIDSNSYEYIGVEFDNLSKKDKKVFDSITEYIY